MPPLSSTTPLGGYNVKSPTSGFTSTLMDTILVSKSKFREWAELEKAKADQAAELYRQQLMLEQSSIDSRMTSLLAVQLKRGLTVDSEEGEDEHGESIAQKLDSLRTQQEALQQEIDNLQTGYKAREKRVQEITLEESKHRARAQEARGLKERVQESKQTTLDDLTRGVVNYKYLGMDFEMTEGANELMFSFSKIDPSNPTSKFSFLLQVNGQDKYEISHCVPDVEASALVNIADHLNRTDDMSFLVREMRRAFVAALDA